MNAILKKYLHLILLGMVSFLLTCTGLVKLDIPSNAFKDEQNWLTVFGSQQRHNSVQRDVSPPYQILWDKKIRSVITDQPLAVQDFLIYTLLSGVLGITDSKTGAKIGDGGIAPGILHAPEISKNILYYTANLGDKTLGALDLNAMKHVWEKKLPQLNTSPLIYNKQLFVGGNNGTFYCVDASDGDDKWKFESGDAIYSIPARSGDRIISGNIAGLCFALNTSSGSVLWKTQLEGNIYGGPLIADDKVFIGTTAGILYALDLNDGAVLWQFTSGGSVYGNPSYFEENIYFGNNNHKVFSLNADTGTVQWQFVTKGIVNSAPLAAPEFLYVGSWDKSFYVLTRDTGELVYRQEFDKPIKASPLIYKGRIYIQTANNRVFCLQTESLAGSEGELP
ncbi:MAG: PQQ-binding-like beta-propeller repeat protein [Calditrichia bacterium]